MKRTIETYNYKLTPQDMDLCTATAEEFAKGIKLSEKDCKRYALSIDEILLRTRDVISDAEIKLSTGIKFFRPFMQLEIKSDAFNAFARDEEDGSNFGNSVLRHLGLSPEYSYLNGINTYYFQMKKKSLNPLFSLLLALASAIIVSLLGMLMPDAIRLNILEGFLTPIYDTFFNILGSIAGPMVFLSVAWGIYGIGDAATIKKIGRKLLGSYIRGVFFFTILFSVICLPIFSLSFSKTGGSGQGLSAIFTMLLNIIPGNIFSPFIDGNTLQIIFLAVVIGIALLFLGQKTASVAKAVEQINYVVQVLIEFICKLVPFFIFVVIIEMMWSDKADALKTVGKFFAVFIACVVFAIVIMLVYTGIRNHVNPIALFKKGLPTLLIALTTASSAAAFGSNISACQKAYGIEEKMTAFGIPLGMVIFKPATAISYLVISLYSYSEYNSEVSVSWFIIMIFTAAILAIATPPVPGGAIRAYTVIFAQLGIPVEALTIAIACDTFLDFIATGADQFLIPLGLLNQSEKLGMIDRKILCNNK